MQVPLRSSYRYIHLSIAPSTQDALTLRKSLQDTITQLFGATSASTYIDILWIDDKGDQVVLRAHEEDVTRLLTAVAMMTGPLRLSVIKQTAFLPAILSARDKSQEW